MNLKTRIRSTFMRRFSSAEQLEKQRAKARRKRERVGAPATVHYFHQVDDPYSHLAVQKLTALNARYAVGFKPWLVASPAPAYQGSHEHFSQWAKQDAVSIAQDFGCQFAPTIDAPSERDVDNANRCLANQLDTPQFAATATNVGDKLWSGQALSPGLSSELAERALHEGNEQRNKLGHYQGAMFYFDGEWFWGIDRIRLLETRLADEGYDQTPGPLCVPEPTPIITSANASQVLLEYFPSLRSPYTAIGHSRVLDLIESTGVTVKVRPVMPMLMRGIPAPRAKQRYIITDSGREGRVHDCPMDRIVDPFGEPVKRAFALFPAADKLGHGMAFVTAYLQAAWFDGTDITTEKGLKHVVQQAGLDWPTLIAASQEEDWQAILADNLAALTQENLWGVPSFRVSGGASRSDAYACWGQDRIWRVASEIAKRA